MYVSFAMDNASKMFRDSHPDTVYDQYLYLHETKEERAKRGKKLQQALSTYPSRGENVDKGSMRSDRSMLNEVLKSRFNISISRAFSNTIRYFKPYDVQPSEEHPDVNFVTQVITFDLYDQQLYAYGEQNSPETDSHMKLLLFRLGCAGEEPSEDTIGIGTNARYGVIVENDQLKPIRIDTDVTRKDAIAGIVRESAAAESSGTTGTAVMLLYKVAMDVVELGADDPMHAEVIDEIDRFIERCDSETPPEAI